MIIVRRTTLRHNIARRDLLLRRLTFKLCRNYNKPQKRRVVPFPLFPFTFYLRALRD
jgi:hypothetical protein